MGLVTPPIHFGRVILYVWNSHLRSQSSKAFFCFFLVVYGRPLCFPFNVTLIMQYALCIIFLETLHLSSGKVILSEVSHSSTPDDGSAPVQ